MRSGRWFHSRRRSVPYCRLHEYTAAPIHCRTTMTLWSKMFGTKGTENNNQSRSSFHPRNAEYMRARKKPNSYQLKTASRRWLFLLLLFVFTNFMLADDVTLQIHCLNDQRLGMAPRSAAAALGASGDARAVEPLIA